MSRSLLPTTGWSQAFAVSALLACAGAAAGQNALGDGRALDRNLQVGSGGVNPQRPNTIADQIRLNNAIITGNATSGRSFRGSVGYRATDTFGGRLGSDDLYSFRRDAAISGSFGAGVRSTDALRYQFALSTGQQVPSAFASAGTLSRSGTASAAANPAALRSTAEYLATQSMRPTLVGGRIDDQGYEWTVKASPLLGVNWVRSDQPIVKVTRTDDKLWQYDLGARKVQDKQEEVTDRRAVRGLSGLETAAAGVESAFDRQASGGLRVPSTRVPVASNEAHSAVLKALQTGFDAAQPIANLPPTQPGSPTQPDAKAQPGSTPPGKDAAPALSTLDAQLERLRKTLRGESPDAQTRGAAKPAAAPRPFERRDPMAPPSVLDRRDEKGTTDSTGSDRSLRDRKSPDDKGTRESERAHSRKPASDKDQKDADNDKLSPTQALTPEIVKAIKSVRATRIDSLMGKTVQAPASTRPDYSLYQQQMQAGEDALIAGKFFQAEDRFGRAIAAAPGEPMARIGRIHAQIGAGLYLSAAANLRSVFADHPELIGATYAQSLIPDNERAEHITEQLRADLGKDISALNKEAAFLMAYLGHVRGDAQLCREGLVEMAKRADMTDPVEATLFEAIRSAWAQ